MFDVNPEGPYYINLFKIPEGTNEDDILDGLHGLNPTKILINRSSPTCDIMFIKKEDFLDTAKLNVCYIL